MRIVGVDPGTHRIGYALIEAEARAVRFLAAETIALPGRWTSAERLALIERELTMRLTRDRPDGMSIERLFFTKNVKTALAVAEARGIILLTASHTVRSIWEYTPLAVKLAVSGYGRADKAQVRRTVRALFPNERLPAGDDAIDAIAIALTAAYTIPVETRARSG